MDKKVEKGKLSWGWMAQHMPGVVELIREHKAHQGALHVNECWRRGVLLGEPGWFYAREGSVSVGTPFFGSEIHDILRQFGSWEVAKDAPLLMLRSSEQGVGDGNH